MAQAPFVNMTQLPFVNMVNEPLDELRLAAVGKTGSGKSKTANTILGKQEFIYRCSGTSVTRKCKWAEANRFGKYLSVVDTPGVFDTCQDNDKTQLELKKFIRLTTPGPHAIIYVTAMGRFTDEDINTFLHFTSHFGERLMEHVIVVFTRLDDWKRDEEDKDNDDNNIDEYIKSLPEYQRNFLLKCHYRYIAFDNTLKGNASDEQVKRLIDMVEQLVKDNGGSCYTNDDYAEAEKIRQEKIAKEKAKKERELIEKEEQIRKETKIELQKVYEDEKRKLSNQIANLHRYIREMEDDDDDGFCSIQ